MTVIDENPLFVVQLFRRESCRKLIDFFVGAPPRKKYRKTAVMDEVGISREALRQAIGAENSWGPLYAFGIVDATDPSAEMPRWYQCDSAVVEYLHRNGVRTFSRWFKGRTRQKLTQFLCETAEANTEYTRRQLIQNSDTSYGTVNNHLDEYIESGIIDVVDAAGNDRVDSYYFVNTGHPILRALTELESLLFETFDSRVSPNTVEH